MQKFDRVAVFSATRADGRNGLGDRVTAFLQAYEGLLVDRLVVQSSDQRCHCLTIILFCLDGVKRRRAHGRS